MRSEEGLDYIFRDSDCVFALWRRLVLVQARRGKLTEESLERLRRIVLPLFPPGRTFGALFVLEAGAPIPPLEVRNKQRALMNDFTTGSNVRIAPVTLGDDVASSMSRSSGRILAAQLSNTKMFSDVSSAAEWLASELAGLGHRFDAKALLLACEAVRTAYVP